MLKSSACLCAQILYLPCLQEKGKNHEKTISAPKDYNDTVYDVQRHTIGIMMSRSICKFLI